MDKNQTVSGLSMAERREKGLLWIDTGENLNQQVYARGLCQEFNQTRPEETEKRKEIWKKLFASCGEDIWIEPPLTLAMGNTVSIGDGTYINSNLTLVDDYKITIGKNVLIAPNVTIGDHSIIGAGSVVTKDIPPNVIAFGHPAEVHREITEEDEIFYDHGKRISEHSTEE